MSILFFATVHPPLLPSHRRHHRSGVFTNSMIGQDHGKCQVGHLALHFPCLLKERRQDVLGVLGVYFGVADDEQELHTPQ